MNKTLTIDIYQDPSTHIEQFLEDWQKFGNYQQNADLSYQLISNNHISVLTMHYEKIIIQGHIPSETFMIIDRLAKSCEADKIVEGEVIDNGPQNFNRPHFNNTFGDKNGAASFQNIFGNTGMPKITTLSKTKLILLLIVAIPILIITIPIIIVVAIVKIILFKLKFK